MGWKTPQVFFHTADCCKQCQQYSKSCYLVIWLKMVNTLTEKSFCVLEFERTRSATTVQRRFRTRYHKDPPNRKSIYDWHRKFKDTGCLRKGKSSGRPATSDAQVELVRATVVNTPRISTRKTGMELQMPHSTVWKIMRKNLKMFPYKLQLLQSLNDGDKVIRFEFCGNLMELQEEDGFYERLIFGDESTFHISGKVNKHNVRIWGTENPRASIEHVRDSPKLNVFCAISKKKVYGPFYFQEATVRGNVYLDMLTEWLMPQLEEDSDDFVWVQDGAPPHWLHDVRDYLDESLPHRWIGRAADNNLPLFRWPPRSPDLTPCDFFLWGYVKDRVFVPPLPLNLLELRHRITAAVQSVDEATLQKVWSEFDFRIDVCRASRGSHIEHL